MSITGHRTAHHSIYFSVGISPRSIQMNKPKKEVKKAQTFFPFFCHPNIIFEFGIHRCHRRRLHFMRHAERRSKRNAKKKNPFRFRGAKSVFVCSNSLGTLIFFALADNNKFMRTKSTRTKERKMFSFSNQTIRWAKFHTSVSALSSFQSIAFCLALLQHTSYATNQQTPTTPTIDGNEFSEQRMAFYRRWHDEENSSFLHRVGCLVRTHCLDLAMVFSFSCLFVYCY